jgi:HAD superfamily hydrolase (TIGR01509 family)
MPLPQAPAAVIFDMDGLLFDSETLYREALFSAGAATGLPVSEALYRQMVGNPWPTIWKLLLDLYGSEDDVARLRVAWSQGFESLAATRLAMKAGVVEILDALDRLGLPRAIATSSQHHKVEHHLGMHGLVGRFHAVVAQGDYAAGKPAPDPFLRAAERLGVPPELCLALEDSHNGVRSASSAGMMTVMVPDLLEATEEMRGLCRAVARDLHEVRLFLLRAHGVAEAPGADTATG